MKLVHLSVIALTLAACTSQPSATVGVSLFGLKAIDDGIGFDRASIGTVRLAIACDDGRSVEIIGRHGDGDTVFFDGAPTCARAALDLTITRAIEDGEVTALIGEAEAQISSPGIDVVFQTRRFGELVIDLGSEKNPGAAETCTVTVFDADPHADRHAAAQVEVEAAPKSEALPLPAGDFTIACGERPAWLATVAFAERVTTSPPTDALPSNDATLSAIVPNVGTLTPAFTSGTQDYTLRVPATLNGEMPLTEVTVALTASHPAARISVGAENVAGALMANLTWQVLPADFSFDVLAEDGTTKRTYTVQVVQQSSDASISDLTVSAGALQPSFSPATNMYVLELPEANKSVDITVTPNDARASVAINGATGAMGSVNLNVGINSAAIVVTAEDGTMATTTLTIRRGLLSAIGVTAHTLVPSYSPEVRQYKVVGSTGTASYNANATASSSAVTVSFNGGVATPGSGTIVGVTAVTGPNPNRIVVKASGPGGVFEEFWINIDRGGPNGDLLMLLGAPTGATGNLRALGISAVTGTMNTGTAPIPLIPDQTSFASNPMGKRIAVGCSGPTSTTGPTISYTAATQDLGGLVTSATAPQSGVVFNPAGDRLYAFHGLVVRRCNFDPVTGFANACVNDSLAATSNAVAAAIDPSGRGLYVVTGGAMGRVYRYDLTGALNEAADNFPLPNTTELVAHPGGALIYAVQGNVLTALHLERNTGAITGSIATMLGAAITDLAIAKDGRVGVTAHGSSTVTMIDFFPGGFIKNMVPGTLTGAAAKVEMHSMSSILYTLEGANARSYQVAPSTLVLTSSPYTAIGPGASDKLLIHTIY